MLSHWLHVATDLPSTGAQRTYQMVAHLSALPHTSHQAGWHAQCRRMPTAMSFLDQLGAMISLSIAF